MIDLETVLEEARHGRGDLTAREAIALVQAYLRRNPPWKPNALVWCCTRCVDAHQSSRTRKGHPKARLDLLAECDLCGREQQSLALEGVLVTLRKPVDKEPGVG